MNEQFLEALPIIKKIEKSGFKAYFVGGAVRDSLIGREIHDVDIATSATPYEIKEIFTKTVDVGIEHGTILVLYRGKGFEVTTFRTESEYIYYRKPKEVAFIRSLKEDLKRRDFTMNAIAMNADGQIIDPFNGKKAILNKVINTVGSPAERFQEDALRLMRAVRFVGELDFKVDENTLAELKRHSPLLQHIAIERVTAEMEKLLAGKYKKRAFAHAVESGLFQFWPTIFNEREVINHLISLSINSLTKDEMWLIGLFLAHDHQLSSSLKQWKLPSKRIKMLEKALTFLLWRQEQQWDDYHLYLAGIDIIAMVEHVYAVIHRLETSAFHILNERFNQLPINSRAEIKVTGKDLMSWTNKQGGPWLREVLTDLEKAIIDRKVKNDYEEIRKWFKYVNLNS